jgi:hypothetical protein
MYFIPEMTQLIFGGLNINIKLCSTFTFIYLEISFPRFVTGTLALITILALVALDALATAEPVIEEVGHVVILIFINHSLDMN